MSETTENIKASQQAVDERHMRRCIELALRAEGHTSPNPMVGAVVVSASGEVIGEGWHHRAGEPHAEVNALRAVAQAGLEHLLPQATIYVSLEPCAHHGRTPPCADLIVSKHLRRCVVGCSDSFAKVDGKGIQKLRAAGIEVTLGVLEAECRWLNRRFFCVQEKHRPWVILKWAQTADGFIGTRNAEGLPAPLAISDATCRQRVHRQRLTEDAILVGRGTALADNPELTARLGLTDGPDGLLEEGHEEAGPVRQPHRFVVGKRENMPSTLRLFHTATPDAPVTVVEEARTAANILSLVAEKGCQSLIVEGGARTLQTFIDEGVWDEAHVYTARETLAELTADPLPCATAGVAAPHFKGHEANSEEALGNCQLRIFVNR